MANTPLLLGLDSSTTSTKAILWDMDGKLVAEGRRTLTLHRPQPLWYEQNANDWWTTACEAIQEAVTQVDSHRLAALSISNQRETFVPVDRTGAPIRNAILWMDQRAGKLLPQLEEHLGAEHYHQMTGKILAGNLTISKLAWMRQHESGLVGKTYQFLDVQAYLVHQLTSRFSTSWGSADPTGLFDMQRRQWSSELLQEVGLRPDQFPEVYPPGVMVGTLTKEAAAQTGLPAGLPVIAGLGDGQCAGLGANITQPGEAYLSLGTSVVSGTFAAQYLTSRYFRTLVGGVPGTYLLESVILGGGYTLDWFAQTFGSQAELPMVDRQAFISSVENQAAEVNPGSDGLMLVPYWNSALDPYWDSTASGIMVGWRGAHTLAHFYRAILEGIAYEQRLHIGGVELSLGERVNRFIAVGGGARNQLWMQIIADITGKPVRRAVNLETASLGAAILAAAGVGLYPDVKTAAQAMTKIDGEPTIPHPERHEFYTRLYKEVYQSLYPSLRSSLSNLSKITGLE